VRRFGVVAIVFAGLLILAQSPQLFFYAANNLPFIGESPWGWLMFGFGLVPVVAALLFGWYLVSHRERLAIRWFDDERVGFSFSASLLLRVGLIVVGIGLLLPAIPTMLWDLWVTVATVGHFVPPESTLRTDLWLAASRAVRDLVEFALGLLLVVRSRQLATWLLAARVEPQPSPEGVTQECPSCGTEYDPSDYREGVDKKCVKCGGPLGE